MNDPAGVPSPFGIEFVEWFSEGGENLTVRVTGRWRRRRPAWSAQPTLVVEAPGRRYRFPAMPEPPSLSGTPPGQWRISFAVPAALAPELGGRAWLQFGAVAVPLPAAVEPLGAAPLGPPPVAPEREAPSPGGAPDRPAAEREAPSPEGAPDRPAAEPEAAPAADGPSEAPRPSTEVEDEATRRRAAQAAEALTALSARVQTLESELAQARSQAEQVVPGAGAGASAAAPAGGEHERLGVEHALIARRVSGGTRVPREPPVPTVGVALAEPPGAPEPGPPEGPGPPAARTVAPNEELLAALRAELHRRAREEAALRVRLAESETRVAARQLLERQTAATLQQLRAELDGLRGALVRERGARETAERHAQALERDLARLRLQTGEANVAIAELRGVIESLRAVMPPAPAEAAVEPVVELFDETAAELAEEPATEPDRQPPAADDPVVEAEPSERLSEALVRLRDAIAPLEAAASDPRTASAAGAATLSGARAPAAPETVDRAWLRPVFTALARTVPDRAGRLLVDLLPAQRAVDPTPLAYDLVLGEGLGCMRVTVDSPGSRVVSDGDPRPRSEVDLRVTGDYAALAKLMAAGRLRRRLGWGVARVRGKRSRLAALDALLDTRLSFGGLYQAGVRMHPRTALTVVAELIQPAWTDGANFVLGYESPPEKTVYLVVGGGAAVEVSDAAPEGATAASISGPAGSLELVLAGGQHEGMTVLGDDEPLTFLREWINRAQSA